MDGLDFADSPVFWRHFHAADWNGGLGIFFSGGKPRVGILRFETTRGDRLFISLLGSAFIHIAWLGLVGANLWWALALSVVYAIGVFRMV